MLYDTPKVSDGNAVPPNSDPGKKGSLHLVFPTEPMAVRTALRRTVARFLRQISLDEAGTLELVLAEVLNNIVEHAHSSDRIGMIEVRVTLDSLGLLLQVADDGAPMPDGLLPEGKGPEIADPTCIGALPEGGFGWFLIRDLSQDLNYCRSGSSNILSFRLPIGASAAA